MKSLKFVTMIGVFTAAGSSLLVGCSRSASKGVNDSAADASRAKRFEERTSAQNKNLNELFIAGQAVDKEQDEYMKLDHQGLYMFVAHAAGEAKNKEKFKEMAIKESMHRYFCPYFDEGIDLKKASSDASGFAQVKSDLDLDENEFEKGTIKTFLESLSKVVNDSSLEVYSGTAGGNNTAGEVMGVYDPKSNEMYYFGQTNCGSDN